MFRSDVQLSLPEWPKFNPIPAGSLHYVPVMLDLPGELDALAHAAAGRAMTTPLIQIAPRAPARGRRALREDERPGWVAARVQKLGAALGDHPFYLEVLSVIHGPRSGGVWPSSVVAQVHDECRRRGLRFIPVHTIGQEGLLEMASEANLRDGRGVAIRYRAGTTSQIGALTLSQRFSDELDRLGVSPGEADLLVDLGWLDPKLEIAAEDVSVILDEAVQLGPWRNLIVVGTSIPASMGEIHQDEVESIPRREWPLWEALRRIRHEAIVFADYGIQHPKAPNTTTGGRLVANVRYTTPLGTIVSRGRGVFNSIPRPLRPAQYVGCCGRLLASEYLADIDCACSGDAAIRACAAEVSVPLGQRFWRNVGWSHHLEQVRLALVRIEASEQPMLAEGRSQSPASQRNGTRRRSRTASSLPTAGTPAETGSSQRP